MSGERGLSPQSTLAVLLGASEWPEAPIFQSSEAFANSSASFKAYLVDDLGLSTENILDLFNDDKSQDEILREISTFLDGRIKHLEQAGLPAKDLLIYFTGHGGFEGVSSDYFLAVRHTWGKNLAASAIEVGALAHTIKNSARFLRHIILLDACFAAAASSAFMSTVDQVVVQRTKAAFQEPLVSDGFPERGTSLLCSSSLHVPSQIAPGEKYTMFSEALLHVLKSGSKSAKDYMSLSEIKSLVVNYLKEVYKDKAPNPELHSPDQSTGDVAQVHLFPNKARLREFYGQQGGMKFEPLDGVIQCCVLVSESEERIERGEPLETVVRRTLIDYQEQILTAGGKAQLKKDPYVISVTKALSSAEAYRDAVIALCHSEIAVFDLTNYEPGIMLLLGIRSVVRRGVTIATAGGDYVIGDTLDFPFNIKEVNILSHSDRQLDFGDPIHLIGDRIIGGFRQISQLPNYLDLPAFDAVRNLPPETSSQQTKDCTEQVLVLCSFSREYQDNNWKRHLKRNLPIYIRSGLAAEGKTVSKQKPEVSRTLDMKSPRLVSQTLYEAIRLTDMCVVDWTEWRPNVFFELGVRVSSNNIGPVCVIEDKHKAFIEEVSNNPNNAQALERPRGLHDRDIDRFTNAASQCVKLLELFDPIEYKAPTPQEKGGVDERSYERMFSYYQNLVSPTDGKAPADPPSRNATYEIITDWIDWKVEAAARPVYADLVNAANLMSNPDIDTQGMSPVLYPGNTTLIQKADEGARERRIAAWFYLKHRYPLEVISNDQELSGAFTDLSNIVAPALLQSSAESDKELGRYIRQQTKALREIKKRKADEGHS
jgi:hypothetical protein